MIDHSTFTDNAANGCYGEGGAISAGGGATTTISFSTFSGYYAYWGGCIYPSNYGGTILTRGTMTISNGTLDGNYSNPGEGGAIQNSGTLTLTNSTVYGNSCICNGGNILNYGTLNLGSTIVSDRNSGSGPDIYGAVTSLGYNLGGNGTGSTGITNGMNHDHVGSGASPVDPKLSVLADNGGPTWTMAVQSSRPAIQAGNCSLGSPAALVTTDQRGQARKNPCDVGAYETQPGGLLAVIIRLARLYHDTFAFLR